MRTYRINLSRATFDNLRLYSGTVIKLTEPTPEEKNIVSFAETIARTTKNEAVEDIASKAQNLDYVNNKIIFIPTMERLTSFEDLLQKLEGLGE